MTIFLTSDNHYYHRNILKFCPDTRPFNDVEEMNFKMIQRHNETVDINDDVYFLGDFSFGDANQTRSVLSQLNGHKHLIYGNHDKVIRKNFDIQQIFTSVQEYKELSYNKTKFILFHYPMIEWNYMHHGSIHCFGHVHGGHISKPHGRSMDVGIDTRSDYRPWHIDEVVEYLKNRPILQHHGD